LALLAEELLAASETIDGLLLVELAKSLDWIVDGVTLYLSKQSRKYMNF
jgi:hypothetical protein